MASPNNLQRLGVQLSVRGFTPFNRAMDQLDKVLNDFTRTGRGFAKEAGRVSAALDQLASSAKKAQTATSGIKGAAGNIAKANQNIGKSAQNAANQVQNSATKQNKAVQNSAKLQIDAIRGRVRAEGEAIKQSERITNRVIRNAERQTRARVLSSQVAARREGRLQQLQPGRLARQREQTGVAAGIRRRRESAQSIASAGFGGALEGFLESQSSAENALGALSRNILDVVDKFRIAANAVNLFASALLAPVRAAQLLADAITAPIRSINSLLGVFRKQSQESDVISKSAQRAQAASAGLDRSFQQQQRAVQATTSGYNQYNTAIDNSAQSTRQFSGVFSFLNASFTKNQTVVNNLAQTQVRAAGTSRQLGGALEGLGSDVTEVTAEIDGLGATIVAALGSTIGNLASQTINRIGDGLRGIVGGAVEATAEFQRITFSLRALTQQELVDSGQFETLADAEETASARAEELFGWLQDLAIVSPFSVGALSGSLRLAQTFGFTSQSAQVLLQVLTDFGAATGQTEAEIEGLVRAIGQINAVGRLTGEELNQLTERGIGRNRLADALGVTQKELNELLSDGQLAANDVIPALVKSLNDDFAGAAANASETIAGLANSLGDLRDVALRETFAGIIGQIQPLVGGLVQILQTNEIQDSLRSFGESVGNAFERATLAIASFAGTINGVVTTVQDIAPGFFALFGNVALFTGGLIALNAAVSASTIVLGALASTFTILLTPIGLIGAAVGALYTAWVFNWGGIQQITEEVVGNVINQIQTLLGQAETDFETVRTFGTTWRNVWTDIGEITNEVAARVQTGFGALRTNINTLLANIRTFASNAKAGFDQFIGVVSDTLSTAAQIFSDFVTSAFDYGANIALFFARGIASGIGLVADAVGALAGIVASLLAPGSPPKALPDLPLWGTSAANEFLKGFGQADFTLLDDLKSGVTDVFDAFLVDVDDRSLLAINQTLAQATLEVKQFGAATDITTSTLDSLVQNAVIAEASIDGLNSAQIEFFGTAENLAAQTAAAVAEYTQVTLDLAAARNRLFDIEKQLQDLDDTDRLAELERITKNVFATEEQRNRALLERDKILTQQEVTGLEEQQQNLQSRLQIQTEALDLANIEEQATSAGSDIGEKAGKKLKEQLDKAFESFTGDLGEETGIDLFSADDIDLTGVLDKLTGEGGPAEQLRKSFEGAGERIKGALQPAIDAFAALQAGFTGQATVGTIESPFFRVGAAISQAVVSLQNFVTGIQTVIANARLMSAEIQTAFGEGAEEGGTVGGVLAATSKAFELILPQSVVDSITTRVDDVKTAITNAFGPLLEEGGALAGLADLDISTLFAGAETEGSLLARIETALEIAFPSITFDEENLAGSAEIVKASVEGSFADLQIDPSAIASNISTAISNAIGQVITAIAGEDQELDLSDVDRFTTLISTFLSEVIRFVVDNAQKIVDTLNFAQIGIAFGVLLGAIIDTIFETIEKASAGQGETDSASIAEAFGRLLGQVIVALLTASVATIAASDIVDNLVRLPALLRDIILDVIAGLVEGVFNEIQQNEEEINSIIGKARDKLNEIVNDLIEVINTVSERLSLLPGVNIPEIEPIGGGGGGDTQANAGANELQAALIANIIPQLDLEALRAPDVLESVSTSAVAFAQVFDTSFEEELGNQLSGAQRFELDRIFGEEFAQQLRDVAKTNSEEFGTSFEEELGNAIVNAATAISEGGTQADAIAAAAMQAGMSVGEGFSQGAETSIGESQEGIGQKILDTIQFWKSDTLEAESPSELAARELGEPIGQGIEAGVVRALQAADIATAIDGLIMGVNASLEQFNTSTVAVFSSFGTRAYTSLSTSMNVIYSDIFVPFTTDTLALIEETIALIIETFEIFGEDLIDLIEQIVKDALDAFEPIIDGMKKIAEEAKEAIIKEFEDLGSKLQSVIRSEVGELSEATYLEEIALAVAPVGNAITEGVAQGIMDNANDIRNALSDVISEAIAGAEKDLGISSPSDVTDERIGDPMGMGLVAGILGTINSVRDAMRTAVESAVDEGQQAADDTGVEIPVTAEADNASLTSERANLTVTTGRADQPEAVRDTSAFIADSILDAMAAGAVLLANAVRAASREALENAAVVSGAILGSSLASARLANLGITPAGIGLGGNINAEQQQAGLIRGIGEEFEDVASTLDNTLNENQDALVGIRQSVDQQTGTLNAAFQTSAILLAASLQAGDAERADLIGDALSAPQFATLNQALRDLLGGIGGFNTIIPPPSPTTSSLSTGAGSIASSASSISDSARTMMVASENMLEASMTGVPSTIMAAASATTQESLMRASSDGVEAGIRSVSQDPSVSLSLGSTNTAVSAVSEIPVSAAGGPAAAPLSASVQTTSVETAPIIQQTQYIDQRQYNLNQTVTESTASNSAGSFRVLESLQG